MIVVRRTRGGYDYDYDYDIIASQDLPRIPDEYFRRLRIIIHRTNLVRATGAMVHAVEKRKPKNGCVD